MIKYKIRRAYRTFKYKLIKKLCTPEEWQTLRNIRAGYYGYKGQQDKIVQITASFELNDASHKFLHSAEGCARYDAKFGIARKLIREKEEEIANCISYFEAYDTKKQLWVCTAELTIIEEVKV